MPAKGYLKAFVEERFLSGGLLVKNFIHSSYGWLRITALELFLKHGASAAQKNKRSHKHIRLRERRLAVDEGEYMEGCQRRSLHRSRRRYSSAPSGYLSSGALNLHMLQWGFQMWKCGRHPHLVVETQQCFTGLVEKRLNWVEGTRGGRTGGVWGGGHLRCLFLLIKLMEKDEEVAFNLG